MAGVVAPRARRVRAVRRLIRPESPILIGTALLVGYLALVPVGYLLWGAFFDDEGFTLDHFRDAYAAYGLGTMAVNSLVFAVGSTAIAVTAGAGLAFLVVRTDVPFRRLAFAAALVPLVVPGVLYTLAWILIASPRVGLFNQIPGLEFDVFGLGGMMLVEGLHLSPLVFLLMAAAFHSMDPALEEAAIASGAKPATVIRRITLPLVAPALFACLLLTMVRALEAFEVPVLLGIPEGRWVLTSRIWRAFQQVPSDLGQAGAYSSSLLVLTALGIFLYWRLTGRGSRFETVAGRGFRPRRYELGRWRRGATAGMAAYLMVASAIPLLMLVYCSLQPVYSTPSIDGLSTLTLDHYRDALGGGSLEAFKNSLLLGVGTATAVMLVMSVVAWTVVRTRVPGRWLLDALASAPLVVPGLVLAVALLFLYLRSPLPVYGTLWILFIAYFTRFMPHGVRFASAAMRQLSGELEDASRASGASWWQTFRRIVLPLLAPGLAAGWIFVFILSMRELSSSILLYSPGSEVVPVRIWQEYQDGQFADPAAIGTLLVAVLALLAGAAWWVGGRLGFRRLVKD